MTRFFKENACGVFQSTRESLRERKMAWSSECFIVTVIAWNLPNTSPSVVNITRTIMEKPTQRRWLIGLSRVSVGVAHLSRRQLSAVEVFFPENDDDDSQWSMWRGERQALLMVSSPRSHMTKRSVPRPCPCEGTSRSCAGPCSNRRRRVELVRLDS